MAFKTKSNFSWQYCFTRELWKKSKSDNSQFPIFLATLKNFLLNFFQITDWKANNERSNFFGNRIIFEEFTSELKGSNWLHWWNCSILDKRKALIKVDLTGKIKASRNLPAGAGKLPPVTCGNRTQSLHFYLRNSLPVAIADKFARASFTVCRKFHLSK